VVEKRKARLTRPVALQDRDGLGLQRPTARSLPSGVVETLELDTFPQSFLRKASDMVFSVSLEYFLFFFLFRMREREVALAPSCPNRTARNVARRRSGYLRRFAAFRPSTEPSLGRPRTMVWVAIGKHSLPGSC